MSIPRVGSTEFQQNVGRFQDRAQRTPVAITKNGREHTIMMSGALFEVIAKVRLACKIEDADDETLDEIARAKVAPEYAHLDDLLAQTVAAVDGFETLGGNVRPLGDEAFFARAELKHGRALRRAQPRPKSNTAPGSAK